MKCAILVVISMFFISSIRADQIILNKNERELLFELKRLELSRHFDLGKEKLLVDASKSNIDVISTQTIRIVFSHRLTKLWNETKKEFNQGVGTSRKLSKIVNDLFKHEDLLSRSLIEQLPPDVLKLLPLGSFPIVPRPKNGDVPLEDVLMEMAIIDSVKLDPSETKDSVRETFKKYRLDDVQKQLLMPNRK